MASLKKERIHPYISGSLEQRLNDYVEKNKRSGATISTVCEAALQQYLDDNFDIAIILRRLDRHQNAIGRIKRDQDILLETFAVWMKMWLAQMPVIPDTEKNAARATAAARWEEITTFVAKRLNDGTTFVDDIVRDKPVSHEELAKHLEDEENAHD